LKTKAYNIFILCAVGFGGGMELNMKLTVNIPNNPYDIIIEKGLLKNVGMHIKSAACGGRCVLITDSNVDILYSGIVIDGLTSCGIEVIKFVFPAGETSKCFDTLLNIYSFLADNKINRGDFIIALGGGVTGDIAGFAASTFMRGIKYAQIPTSLLAQVDSSIGGKVAVDMPQGKNMVGNFYHPKIVLIDPLALKTLKPEFFADGMAEVIKYGCIKDENLFNLLNSCTPDELEDKISEIIYKCVAIKKEIVENDERDLGERMLLNFGHTMGHAIEKYYNYNNISHGMAVAIGMRFMSEAGEILGITEAGTSKKIESCLKKYLLPYSISSDIMEKIPEFVVGDKKNFGKNLNLIMLSKIGSGIIFKIPYEEFKQWRFFNEH